GNSSAINTPMIAITTRSSIRVKPLRRGGCGGRETIGRLLQGGNGSESTRGGRVGGIVQWDSARDVCGEFRAGCAGILEVVSSLSSRRAGTEIDPTGGWVES